MRDHAQGDCHALARIYAVKFARVYDLSLHGYGLLRSESLVVKQHLCYKATEMSQQRLLYSLTHLPHLQKEHICVKDAQVAQHPVVKVHSDQSNS